MSTLDQLIVRGVGGTDSRGDLAPAAGVHSGTSTVVMVDNVTYLVAANAAEVQRKRDTHAVARVAPQWVAFDQPNTAVPIILDVSRIQTVIDTVVPIPPAPPPGPGT